MTTPDDLARRLYDHLTITGRLYLDTWCTFEREHGVQGQQCEPVLVEVIGHLCTLAGELTAEVGRLSVALSRRG
jgi:hypothetical protein